MMAMTARSSTRVNARSRFSVVNLCFIRGQDYSAPINVLAMPHALDFNQLRFRDDFINNAAIAQPDAIGMFRATQFFHTMRKWIFRQTFNRLENWLRCADWQLV